MSRGRGGVLGDVAVILGAFAAAGVLAGLLWPHLVTPVEVSRTEFGLTTPELSLGARFDNDGWFMILGVAFGIPLGLLLTASRRRDEVVTLLLVVAGAVLASWLTAEVGRVAGPLDPRVVLADAPLGATAPAMVTVAAEGAWFAWPVGALIGACLVLWAGRAGPGEAP